MIAKNVTDSRPHPANFSVYEKWVNVVGEFYRLKSAVSFIKGKGQWVELECEPDNPYSKYAIKVFGGWRGLLGSKRQHIGYLPDKTAKALHIAGVAQEAQARVHRVYLSDREETEIRLTLIGPEHARARYRAEATK